MSTENNSGTPSAEEIQKMEKDLEVEAEKSVTEPQPSEFENQDDDEEEKPPKKETKKTKTDDKEDEEEDEDDIDDDEIEEDAIDEDDKDDDDEGDKPQKGEKIPAWMVKMQERRLNKAVEEARKEEREKFEKEHGRKPNADEKKDIDADLVEDFKNEFGIEPDENTTNFLKFLDKRNKKNQSELSPETQQRLAKIEEDAQKKAEEIGFENDFIENKKLIDKLFPDADQKALDRIKAKVKELAYSEDYVKYKLADIIRLNRKTLAPVERKKTGEPSRGGSGQARYTAGNIDPDKIDWESMSVEEAEKTMTELEKQQGNKSRMTIFRKGKKIN